VDQARQKALFDKLTELGDDMSTVPRLALRWQANSDATSRRFTLRDANFHDGKPAPRTTCWPATPAVESLAKTLLFFGVAQQFLKGAQNISVGLLRGLGGHRGPVTPALPERSAPGRVDFVESFLISE
jgi:hypothetical protein